MLAHIPLDLFNEFIYFLFKDFYHLYIVSFKVFPYSSAMLKYSGPAVVGHLAEYQWRNIALEIIDYIPMLISRLLVLISPGIVFFLG